MILETLQADPSSDLDWVKKGKGTPFLDFGWKSLDPFDPGLFNANFLAVEEFAKRFPDVKKVVLARLDGDFEKLIAPSEAFDEGLKESGLKRNIFCAQLISEYLHRLASGLGFETEPIVLFDLPEDAGVEMILLLSRRRFEHFQVEFAGKVLPIQGNQEVMIALPQDENFQKESLEQIIAQIGDRPFKCIPEELLNEHWDEVEEIWIDPETIGDMGKRMLLGFEAAGGEIKKAKP